MAIPKYDNDGRTVITIVVAIVLVVSVAVFVTRPVYTVPRNPLLTKENFEMIQFGMTVSDVELILGPPRPDHFMHYDERVWIQVYYNDGLVMSKHWRTGHHHFE